MGQHIPWLWTRTLQLNARIRQPLSGPHWQGGRRLGPGAHCQRPLPDPGVWKPVPSHPRTGGAAAGISFWETQRGGRRGEPCLVSGTVPRPLVCARHSQRVTCVCSRGPPRPPGACLGVLSSASLRPIPSPASELQDLWDHHTPGLLAGLWEGPVLWLGASRTEAYISCWAGSLSESGSRTGPSPRKPGVHSPGSAADSPGCSGPSSLPSSD